MDMHRSEQVLQLVEHAYRVIITFLVLTWLFIFLRVYTRTFVNSSLGWDDCSMILAGMAFTTYCATVLYIKSKGAGTTTPSFEELKLSLKLSTVAESSYVLTMMCIKISIAIFFSRIVVKRQHLIMIYIAIAISVASAVPTYFYCYFRCGTNLDDYLVRQVTENCVPFALDMFMAYQQAAFNALTDVIFVALPVLVLWNARMERRAKVSAGIILLIATLGTVCSIVRFRYINGLLAINSFLWNAVNTIVWSTIEAGTCIIAACTATLRPLLKSVLGRRISSALPLKPGTPQISQHSKCRSSRIIRISDTDLEYGSTSPVASLKKSPAYIELVPRPDSAHIAPPSVTDSTHAESDSIIETRRLTVIE